MRDKVVLITGGTGTFGNAFVRQVLELSPRQIRVFSRDELKQFRMKCEINDPRVEFILGDIRDYERLKVALRGVDVCIHAAALKRVEAGQRDPQEFIKTNVQGTINVANACIENRVSSAVLISSDKAVCPINVYGGSKFLAEQVWINSNVYRGNFSPTKLSVVRYGNVLGSRGSLLQIWQDQAEAGVIKVTDPRMTRFWLPIKQAVDLVCLITGMQQGGEIYLPCLKSTPVLTLAQTLIGKAKIEYTGNRGGEKLHEVLATEDEFGRMATFDGFSVIHPFNPTWHYNFFDGEKKLSYHTSETAEQYTDDELKELVAATA